MKLVGIPLAASIQDCLLQRPPNEQGMLLGKVPFGRMALTDYAGNMSIGLMK